MWAFLGIFVLASFALVHSSGNESFPELNIKQILQAETFTGVGEVCAAHLMDYLNGLRSESWALKMADSITKFPDGVLMGHFSIPGHFDECVNAFNENFRGKHCMANLTLKSGSAKFKIPNLYYKKEKNQMLQFSYGLCIPSTCNSTDIENTIRNVEELNFLEINLSEMDCSTNEFPPFRTEDWITVAVLIVIFAIALGSTAYDVFQRFVNKNESPSQLWSSFSIYRNGKQLFSISQSSSQLKCLHGIRFLSMSWVILGHSYFSFLFGAPINLLNVETYINDKSFAPISNAFVSVDSFFFLSGLLVCLVFFRDIAKKKTFDVPVAFIHRYMRLTPPFALLMLIQSTIISRVGNGPFWNARTNDVETACRDSWWTGLLYIQNYVKPKAMCLGQAWYLSADMQMYWVSPLILYPMLWFPSFAPVLLLLLILGAAFINFAVAFINNMQPNLLITWSSSIMTQFEVEYVPFHTRMAPWLIGVATGYIICGMQAKKIPLKLSKLTVMVGWVAGLSLLGGSLFGILRFIPANETEFSTAESAFYLAFHRVGWALGMGWVVIACVGGYGGPVNHLLSLDFFQPLGKLSYCNFLIHMTLQNYRINSSRTNQYLRHFDIVYSYFGDLLISNLISIPVVLLFEFPFTNLDRHFLQKLVIFPLPKPKKEMEKENKEEISEKPSTTLEDVEKGKENQAFSES